jgi:hypothetical protein
MLLALTVTEWAQSPGKQGDLGHCPTCGGTGKVPVEAAGLAIPSG